MIEHEEARLQLADLVVAGLADATRIDALRSHVAACAACRSELADLELLDQTIRDAGPVPAPSPDLSRRVLAIAAGHPPVRTRMRRATAARAIGALVGVVALVVLSLRVGGGLQVSQTVRFAAGQGWHAAGSVEYGKLDGVPTVHLHLSNLPRLRSGYYEIWVARSPSERLSLGVYDASAAGTLDVTLPAPGGDEGYKGIWVTSEPEDNNPMWSNDTVAAARLA